MSARAPSLINSPPLLLVKVGRLPALSHPACPLASAMLASVLGSATRLPFPCRRRAALRCRARVEMLSRVRGEEGGGLCEGRSERENALSMEEDEARMMEGNLEGEKRRDERRAGEETRRWVRKTERREKTHANREKMIPDQGGWDRAERDGVIGGCRRVQIYYAHPLSDRCKSNVTAGQWACA